MVDAYSLTVSALFFDDIRLEIGNKLSLMGQYINEMYVAHPSVPIDRISILLHARWPKEYNVESCFARIDIPGQPKAEYQDLPLQFDSDPKSDDSVFSIRVLQAVLNLRFPPLRNGDVIDVWFMANDHEYAAGRLRIKNVETAN